MKPRVLIMSGYGLNCEDETKYAFDTAGGYADIVHVNDIITNKELLGNYQIIVFPGGFAYGDDLGSGVAYASKVKNHLWEALLKFIEKDRLILGICNGFQIMVNLGILPAVNNNYGTKEVALLPNKNARYTVRFVDVKVTDGKSPWLMNLISIPLPIAHGEGKFYATDETLALLKKKKMIALKYFQGEVTSFLDLSYNPNGSLDDIAGITNENGKILGLMPHPERAISFYQLPNWNYLREKSIREGKKFSEEGPGLSLFKNGIKYFS